MAPSLQRWSIWLLLCLLVSAGTVVGGSATTEGPRIVGVHPNPISDGNAGEFVVIEVSEPRNVTGWRLRDDRRSATFPATTIEGRVAVSTEPAVARVLTELPVVALSGGLRLSSGGDRLTLATATGKPLDTITYQATDDATRWRRTAAELRPVNRFATNWSFRARENVTTQAFLLPDAPEVPLATVRNATDRIRLAGYQLSSPAVVDALRRAAGDGVDVDVLVDGSPVSGQTTREQTALDALVAGGVDVRVTEASRDPYRYHHPKYAVVDEAAIVMTENWKPAGTGGRSSRGWGVRVDDARVAADLATVFQRDFGGPAAIAWVRYRTDSEPITAAPPNASYPTRQEPMTTSADRVRVAVGPEAIAARQRAAIANATASIRIQQVSIGGPSFPLLAAAVRAARRGVSVRILLDGSWYVASENEVLVEHLNTLAAREELPLSARIVEPGSAFEKIHAKGLVVDERTVIVGSANWNNVSLQQNRELALAITDPAVGGYFARGFDADWRGARWTTPIGLGAVAGAAWLTAGTVASRRITFDP